MASQTKVQKKSVEELFRDGRAIDAAVKRAVRRVVTELDREKAARGKKTKPRPAGKARPPTGKARASVKRRAA